MSSRRPIGSSRQEMIQAAIKALRQEIPEKVEIVVVSKTVAADDIKAAYDAGIRDFGENRVQELLEKVDALPQDIRWHLIGHLQTNKVKQVLGHVALIQSLDRRELADEIDKQAAKLGIREVPCLLQIKTSDEETKHGLDLNDARSFIESMPLKSVIKIRGLMTLAPFTDDEGKIRKSFRDLRALRDKLQKQSGVHTWNILSMGMSGDYKIAVEEGSNMVRIGTAIFGKRN